MAVPSVREAVKEFLAAMRRKRNSKTCDGYEQRLLVFCDWLEARAGEATLNVITARLVDDFVVSLRETHTSHRSGSALSSQTLIGYVRYIKVFLSFCEQDEEYCEHIRPTVLKRIQFPTAETFLVKPFDSQHIQSLLLATQEQANKDLAFRDECILRLLLATGIRATELCTLQIEHTYLEPETCYIRVFGKRQKWREIPLIAFPVQGARKKKMVRGQSVKQLAFSTEQENQLQAVTLDDALRRMLKRYRNTYRAQAGVTEPLFLSRYHDPLNVDSLEKLIRRLVSQAGITLERASPHVFRHTWAALFMKHVGNIYLLSKLMGHSSVRTTEEYLKSLQGEEVRTAFLRQIGEL